MLTILRVLRGDETGRYVRGSFRDFRVDFRVAKLRECFVLSAGRKGSHFDEAILKEMCM